MGFADTNGDVSGLDSITGLTRSASVVTRSTLEAIARCTSPFFRVPPNRIGFGSLHYMACQVEPNWRNDYDDAVSARLHAAAHDEALHEYILSEMEAEAANDTITVNFKEAVGDAMGGWQQQARSEKHEERSQSEQKEEKQARSEQQEQERSQSEQKEEKQQQTKNLLQHSSEFVAGFVPPDYLIDGLVQRQYVYSMTAPTGDGKTCIALRVAAHCACGLKLGSRDVDQVRVLFFAGENPEDVRAKWIKLCEEMDIDPAQMDVFFLAGAPDISNTNIRRRINEEALKNGPFGLLVIDTSAAYFKGDDENSNAQLGEHARMMRTFVKLPGGPTVIVTCHPVKNADRTNLLPRGGGAFLAEVDGNLVVIKEPGRMVAELHWHGKFRGADFAPMPFKLASGTSDRLKDTKGRKVWTATATPITAAEQDIMNDAGARKEDQLLVLMADRPGLSLAEMAQALGWTFQNGELNRSLVQRTLKALTKDKLVENRWGTYTLTRKGREAAAAARRTDSAPAM
jgi:hypothetical protein